MEHGKKENVALLDVKKALDSCYEWLMVKLHKKESRVTFCISSMPYWLLISNGLVSRLPNFQSTKARLTTLFQKLTGHPRNNTMPIGIMAKAEH